MLMGIDERRHDDAPLGINELSLREFLLHFFQCTYFLNHISIHCHRAVLDEWITGIPCHQTSVPNN